VDRLTFGRNPSLARLNALGEVIQNGLTALTLLHLGTGNLAKHHLIRKPPSRPEER
jgi:hypothetical protein